MVNGVEGGERLGREELENGRSVVRVKDEGIRLKGYGIS